MRFQSCLPAAAVAIMVGGACAGGGTTKCDEVPSDVAMKAGVQVYTRCAVNRSARRAGSAPRLNYSPSGTQACGRVVIQYVIDAQGRAMPATMRVVRSNDGGLADAVMSMITTLRFEPALKNGVPVAQLDEMEQGYTIVAVSAAAGSPSGAARQTARTSARRC